MPRAPVLYRGGEDLKMTEQLVRPEKKEKDKYDKDKPLKPGEAIPDKGESPDHEGATDDKIGDRTGPGAGFDGEPAKVKDKGGVAPS